MNKTTPPEGRAPKRLRLVARIWSAPIILITFGIAVGNIWNWLTNGAADPYAVEGTSFIEALPPTLMFISAIGLALAWRWELFGAGFSLFVTAGLVIVLLIQRPPSGDLSSILIPYLLALVILIPGVLFLIYGLRSKAARIDR